MDFIEKVKGFLLEPSKTFDALKEEPLEETLKFYAVIAAIYSALFALLLTFAGNLFGTMMEFGNMEIKIGAGTLFAGNLFGTMMGFGNMGMMMGSGTGIGAAITFFVRFMIISIVSAFIGGVTLHIFVYIMGGRRGIAQTIKAIMYGSTPSLLFGWTPVIVFLAMIWSLVAQIIGIRQLHELRY